MFEGIPFINFSYSKKDIYNLSTVQKQPSELLNDAEQLPDDSVYIEDSSYCFDCICHVCRTSKTNITSYEPVYMENISYLEAGKGYFTKRKNLKSYLIKYTLEGEGLLIYDGKEYKIGPKTGFLIDCTKSHYYKTNKAPWKHIDLHINGETVQKIYSLFHNNKLVTFTPDSSSEFQRQIEKILLAESSINRYRDYITSGMVNQLLVEILMSTTHYKKETEYATNQLKYLVHYIENNFSGKLSLDYLAEFSSLSKYHMCRIFKKYMGCTVNEYITKLRIERAAFLLQNTTLNANQIGYMVGFKDENYFYRAFKKYMGVSPRRYAKNS